jgi:hypothetical protein
MKVFKSDFENKADITFYSTLAAHFSIKEHTLENLLFFDIETTGLSANRSMVYLIGCAYFKGDSLKLTQFFADTPDCENEVIENFLKMINKDTILISFNGANFDIPFIVKRSRLLKIQAENLNFLAECEHADILRIVRSCAKLLSLDDYRQKTVEVFLGLNRKDSLGGGDLIPIYRDYVISHDKESKELILLHNHDDLEGLAYVSTVYAYRTLYDHSYTFEAVTRNDDTLSFVLKSPFTFPQTVSKKAFLGNSCINLQLKDDKILLNIPLFEGTLKYFYPNYKDYYYLTEEDCAVHKSVAAFVYKNHRRKATAKNCYSKLQAVYIIIDIHSIPNGKYRIFKNDYDDTFGYVQFSEEICGDMDYINLMVDMFVTR